MAMIGRAVYCGLSLEDICCRAWLLKARSARVVLGERYDSDCAHVHVYQGLSEGYQDSHRGKEAKLGLGLRLQIGLGSRVGVWVGLRGYGVECQVLTCELPH